MRRDFAILLTLVLALVIAGCTSGQTAPENAAPVVEASSEQAPEAAVNSETASAKIIEMTSEGFVPAALTIKQGESVTFVSKDSRPRWPASAMHPTHMVYPGSDIQKCGTAEQDGIFDACKEMMQAESFTFTFNEKGTWRYHDHVVSGTFGAITVE